MTTYRAKSYPSPTETLDDLVRLVLYGGQGKTFAEICIATGLRAGDADRVLKELIRDGYVTTYEHEETIRIPMGNGEPARSR